MVSVGTLPETNSSHLKMDGWNTSFLLGWPIFRGDMLVSGKGKYTIPQMDPGCHLQGCTDLHLVETIPGHAQQVQRCTVGSGTLLAAETGQDPRN